MTPESKREDLVWWLSRGSVIITKPMLVLISLNLLAAKWVDLGSPGAQLRNCGVIARMQIASIPLNLLASSLVARLLLPSDSSRWPLLSWAKVEKERMRAREDDSAHVKSGLSLVCNAYFSDLVQYALVCQCFIKILIPKILLGTFKIRKRECGHEQNAFTPADPVFTERHPHSLTDITALRVQRCCEDLH